MCSHLKYCIVTALPEKIYPGHLSILGYLSNQSNSFFITYHYHYLNSQRANLELVVGCAISVVCQPDVLHPVPGCHHLYQFAHASLVALQEAKTDLSKVKPWPYKS